MVLLFVFIFSIVLLIIGYATTEDRVLKKIESDALSINLTIKSIRSAVKEDGKHPFKNIEFEGFGPIIRIFGIDPRLDFYKIVILEGAWGEKIQWVKVETNLFIEEK